ncbi:SHOCT domain-containing protein [Alkalihalobacillus macyae]|uniref:SHOCT domain-containing protein n=1 Tax=Guptibacillus hwajinpoensis TaxID=208199 RepID=UPI00273B90A5|nr:SHOCT domain-containing protein [Alkalihalobacillus macyae]MDP4552311.1 SHOCT domain-containing protein [Alkalihalobacillus macyae]
MMNGGGMGGMGNSFFGFGFLFILIIIAIIVVVFWMRKPGSSSKSSSTNSAETLKERLANGEITEEEYDRLKRKLNS